MTRESWRDLAARVVVALGGLVRWSAEPLKIGSVVRNLGSWPCAEPTADQPFVAIGEAESRTGSGDQPCAGSEAVCPQQYVFTFELSNVENSAWIGPYLGQFLRRMLSDRDTC